MLETRDLNYKKVPSIPLKSPLAIGGFFINLLQLRFSDKRLPWIWNEDSTQTGIFILSGQTIENEIRNARPAVYVNVGQLRIGNMVIGNTADFGWHVEDKHSYSRVEMNVTIHTESDNKGEAHGLGWLVASTIASAQDVIRTKFEFANLGPIDLAPPQYSKNTDRETFISTISIGISYELTWTVTAVQTFIKELELNLSTINPQNHNELFTKIYINKI